MTYATSQSGDREAIVRPLNTYIAGGVSGKSSDMRPAFHDGEWKIVSKVFYLHPEE